MASAALEKQTRELQDKLAQAEAKGHQRGADLDLQVKCSNDARQWFLQNWSRDKNTLLLDHENHYNKALNKCFAFVQFNRSVETHGTADKSISLYDVYENVERGHGIVVLSPFEGKGVKFDTTCRLDGEEKKLKEFQECFDWIWHAYMEK